MSKPIAERSGGAPAREPTAARPAASAQEPVDGGRRGSALVQVSEETWAGNQNTAEQRRVDYIDRINDLYHQIVTEFFNTANACAANFQRHMRRHRIWRWTMIIATGILAIVNILAANAIPGSQLPVAAAIAATLLTILANLENFSASAERAQVFRDAREMFLDAGREFQGLWETYVIPFHPGPNACLNARELLRRIYARDAEVRRKFKDLTGSEDQGK